jgi:hypothetical protein
MVVLNSAAIAHGVAASRGRALAIAAALATGICLTDAAQAGLGEGADSVSRDRTALRGTSDVITPMAAYDLHEITTADGNRVHEFVSRAGTVFGVAWSGRTKPDLSVLLAAHYADYLKAAAANHFNHKVLSVNGDGFAMQIMKLPRGFVGSAHVPALLPSGTSAQEIR